MLNYTMSDDRHYATIDPCKGATVRLSIIRFCRKYGWEIPPETLEVVGIVLCYYRVSYSDGGIKGV